MKARLQNLSLTDAAKKSLGKTKTRFYCGPRTGNCGPCVGLSDLRTLAYTLAKMNNIEHPFNKEKQKGGKTCMYGFLKTPTIILCAPQRKYH